MHNQREKKEGDREKQIQRWKRNKDTRMEKGKEMNKGADRD
jgi:hypothetical protein